MDKRLLNKIAKEWACGILFHGTGMDSFTEEDGLTYEEEGHIVNEVAKIALRITKGEIPSANLSEIVKKYYTFDE